MPYFVYILLSGKDGKLYTGCTTNLKKRLQKHNSGKVSSTSTRRPFTIIHSESFENKGAAFNRERFLKSLWAGRFKKNLIKKFRKG